MEVLELEPIQVGKSEFANKTGAMQRQCSGGVSFRGGGGSK